MHVEQLLESAIPEVLLTPGPSLAVYILAWFAWLLGLAALSLLSSGAGVAGTGSLCPREPADSPACHQGELPSIHRSLRSAKQMDFKCLNFN